MGITFLGLGSGPREQLTVEAAALLDTAPEIVVRCVRHPVVAGLPQQVAVRALDEGIGQRTGLAGLHTALVDQVWDLAQRPEGVLYAVPGQPLAGDVTVRELIARCRAAGTAYRVLPGVSVIEPALAALELGPASAEPQTVDALDLQMDAQRPSLITHVAHETLAGAVKRELLKVFPPAHPVTVVNFAGAPGEQVRRTVLETLDEDGTWDALSCIYVPALDPEQDLASYGGLQRIVARLRAPDGCPWDREQTHASLKPHVLEETYEVLQALDDEDMGKLAEEMGDLVMNLLMQAQIAAEAGEFTMNDVFRLVNQKLIRRHPHVFAGLQVSSSQEVLANWEVIKGKERQNGESALAGIPDAMPALAYSRTMLAKAGRLGLQRTEVEGPNPAAALRSIVEGQPREEQIRLLGTLLLGVVDLSREFDLDPEEALRAENARFRRRFSALEEAARQAGQDIAGLPPATIRSIWQTQT